MFRNLFLMLLISTIVPIFTDQELTSEISKSLKDLKESKTCPKPGSSIPSNPQKNDKPKLDLKSWLVSMKEMWNDFKPYVGAKKVSPDKWLDSCLKEDYTLGQGLFTTQKGTIKGQGVVTFNQKSHCAQTFGIILVNGTFQNSLLNGMGTIQFNDSSILRVPFVRGVKSGLARVFTCMYGACDFEVKEWNEPTRLSKVSFFIDGKEVGPAWEFKIGGGVITGALDAKSQLTGEDIVYVYPDYKTILAGKFEKSVMVSAKETILIGAKFDELTKIPILQYDKKKLEISKIEYTYEPSTKTVLPNPLVQDPFEQKHVYVAASKVPEAGEGAFIKHPAKKGSVVAFYNGVRIKSIEKSLSVKDRTSPYRIDNDWAAPAEVLDIPVQYRGMSKYNASLGHMLNHAKHPNAWYGMVDHPRFGLIRSIVLSKDVEADEELFCDYGYLENYVRTETSLHYLYKFGKWITQKDDAEFSQSVKEQIRFLRDKSDQFKPFVESLKTLTPKLSEA